MPNMDLNEFLARKATEVGEANTDYEKCPSCDGAGLATNNAGEPDICRECMGDTVVCAEGVETIDPDLIYMLKRAWREKDANGVLWAKLPSITLDHAIDAIMQWQVNSRENKLIAEENSRRADRAEQDRGTLHSALRQLLDCANAMVGADISDPDAQEAFDMFDAARKQARGALNQK